MAVPVEATTRKAGATRHAVDVWAHLVRREVAASNRLSVVGAAWPLLRQLAQLAILVIAFSAVLDLGIENYPVFVFSGLVGWTWFVSGVNAATTSITTKRSLALRPGFPSIVLPAVDIAVPLVDVLFALPVLAVMLVATGELHTSSVLLIPLLAMQGFLMLAIGVLCAAISVFIRDIPNLVSVVTLMAFYLTPVFFDVARVPEDYQWLLRLNPMAVLLEADRAALLGRPWPPIESLVGVGVFSVALLAVSVALFRKLAPHFADEL